VNWPPRQRVLEGVSVRLEAIEPAHREGLAAASGEPATWEWLDRRIPDDRAAFDAWFDERMDASSDGREWCLVTHAPPNWDPIGSSSYLNIRRAHDGLEIGWTWLHPSAWRTGANVEAKLLMLAHAFGQLGCIRVEFKTDARNTRSRTALSDLGATFEGVLRKHLLMPGLGVWDSAVFSVTDEDWSDVRARLHGRLARHA